MLISTRQFDLPNLAIGVVCFSDDVPDAKVARPFTIEAEAEVAGLG